MANFIIQSNRYYPIVIPDVGGGGGASGPAGIASFAVDGGTGLTPASVDVVLATPMTADYDIELQKGMPLNSIDQTTSPPDVWYALKTLNGFRILAQAQIGTDFEVSWVATPKTQ